MNISAFLDWLWLTITVAGVLALGISELQQLRKKTWKSSCRQAATLFLVSILLFPCISSTDDSLSLQTFTEEREEFGNPEATRDTRNPAQPLMQFLQLLHNCNFIVAHAAFQLGYSGLFLSDSHVQYDDDSFIALSAGRSPPEPLLI